MQNTHGSDNDPANASGVQNRSTADAQALRQAILAQTLDVMRGRRRRKRLVSAAGWLGCYLAGVATVALALPFLRGVAPSQGAPSIASTPEQSTPEQSPLDAGLSPTNRIVTQPSMRSAPASRSATRWNRSGDELLMAGDPSLPADFLTRRCGNGSRNNRSATCMEAAETSLMNYQVLQRLLKDIQLGNEAASRPTSPIPHSQENPS